MEGEENFGNNHWNSEGGSGERLSAESLPLIDTRLLSQSELRSLAHCSSFSPSSTSSASLAASAGVDDDLTPKIDRSVFNESAGSRKQTFLRLRLARHPPPPRPPSPQRQRDDSSPEEKSQVASLLRSLFSVDSIQREAEEDEGEEELEENEGQPLIPVPIHDNRNVYRNPYFDDSVKNVLAQGISENETRRRRGRPRKIPNPKDDGIYEETADSEREGPFSVDKSRSNLGTESRYDDASGISMDLNQGKRKRGRPRKSGDGFNQVAVNCKSEDKEEIVKLWNREGAMVDLTALANCSEDPYGEELKRITLGFVTKEEFLGFLEQLNGEWVNAGKKKKVVEACDYGGYLPRGWNLELCIKKKGNNMWLACRRYISPNGQEFATCKEVSTYLQSLLESRGNTETNQNRESERTGSEVLEEAKGSENGDITDLVKNSLVEEDDKRIPTAEVRNEDNEDDMKQSDDNMENLVAQSNSRAQFAKDLMKTVKGLSSTSEKLLEFLRSQNH